MMDKLNKLAFIISVFYLLTACSPMIYRPGEKMQIAEFRNDKFITEDGAILPVKKWLPEQNNRAVIIALHGFNDYSQFFQLPGSFFKQHGIACYAYDQRGFGESPERGHWPGLNTYSDDLAMFIRLIKQQHPDTPIYLLGHSMGGAIIIVTMAQEMAPSVNGVILAAPAVWGRVTMPWYQTTLLWTLSHTLPWLTLTGEGLDIKPSDNIEMLKALGRDPLVIKETRVETIYGLANLMDAALNGAEKLDKKTMLLYGEQDQVIPKKPTYQFLRNFDNTSQNHKTIAFYPNGYHMLLRDLQAETVWKDIVSWIIAEKTPLPSGAIARAKEILYHSETIN
jgi:alpha-beta hydrolase superfamily lysophospholipase